MTKDPKKDQSSEEHGMFHNMFEQVTNLLTEEVPGSESDTKITTSNQQESEGKEEKTPSIQTDTVKTKNAIDQDAYKAIVRSIRKKGPDYDIFFDMVKRLGEDIDDEIKLFRASLKALKDQVDVDAIIASIDSQIAALPEEKRKFDSFAEAKNSKIETQEKEIVEAEKEVESLRQQIAEIETANEARRKEVESGRQSIDETRRRFESTLSKIEDELNSDKEKVAKYLKGGK